jgi:hypothetical protein
LQLAHFLEQGMLQAVMMILLHERLLWLGIRNVESKIFLAHTMTHGLVGKGEVVIFIENDQSTDLMQEFLTVFA